MTIRALFWLGIIVCLCVLVFAIGRILLGLGALYLFTQAFPSPPAAAAPPPPPPPATILPQGYRGLAIICSEQTPMQTPSAQSPITIPESGVVRVKDLLPPTRWQYSDGTMVEFHTPSGSDPMALYATYTDWYVRDFGTVWIVCIGNRAEHATFESQQNDVYEAFVASGYSSEYRPPHENVSPFRSESMSDAPPTSPPHP